MPGARRGQHVTGAAASPLTRRGRTQAGRAQARHGSKVPVSERALIQRINRKLAVDEEIIRAYRGGRWESDLGRHYIVNWNRNTIVQGHVDLEKLGRELGVLRPWEEIRE